MSSSKIVGLKEPWEFLEEDSELNTAVEGSTTHKRPHFEALSGNEWWSRVSVQGFPSHHSVSASLADYFCRQAETYHYRYFHWPTKARGLSESDKQSLARTYMLRILVLSQMVSRLQREGVLLPGPEPNSYISALYDEAAVHFRTNYKDRLFLAM